MEPLLQRIKEDRTAVLTPIIDVIDDKTLQYYNSNGDFFQVCTVALYPQSTVQPTNLFTHWCVWLFPSWKSRLSGLSVFCHVFGKSLIPNMLYVTFMNPGRHIVPHHYS